MMVAVVNGHFELADQLITEHGLDVNQQDLVIEVT